MPRRNSLTKYVRTPTASDAACSAALATGGSRKTLPVRSSSAPCSGNSRSSRAASASSQCSRSAALALAGVKSPVELSLTKSILARSGRPTFFWSHRSGTNALKGEIWLAWRLKRPKSRSDTISFTFKRIATEESTSVERGASRGRMPGFSTRSRISSPSRAPSCAASRLFKNISSLKPLSNIGLLAPKAQKRSSTPSTWTWLTRAVPSLLAATPRSRRTGAVTVSNAVSRSSASFARK